MYSGIPMLANDASTALPRIAEPSSSSLNSGAGLVDGGVGRGGGDGSLGPDI